MSKKTVTREYAIRFRLAEPAGSPEQTRNIRASNPDQAKARLEVAPDLAFAEIVIIECKAVAGTQVEGTEERQEAPRNNIADRLASAEEFSDGPRAEDAGDATPEPPEDDGPPIDTAPQHLTRAEWRTLRECVVLDENDADNAARLLKWFGGRMLNVFEAGWHVWTGTHWDGEGGAHAVERFAHQVVARIKREAALLEFTKEESDVLAEAAAIVEEHSVGKSIKGLSVAEKRVIEKAEEISKALAKKKSGRFQWGVRAGDRSRTKAMIDQAEPHCTVMPDQLDSDDHAINCLNGVVRIVPSEAGDAWEWVFDDHNPNDLFTKVAGTKFDPKADCPTFKKDLERFQPRAAERDFLQVYMGYTLLGVTGEQVYAFLYGDGGNWKSAFLQVIARTVGSYYKPMSYKSVSGNNMPTGDKPSPDWARLSGVRFLAIEEVPRKEPIQEELIKLMTSGTPMPVRHLNKGMFDLRPKFKVSMTSNAEPNVAGHDKGIWRRTLIIPWDVAIPDNERMPFEQAMAIYDRERAGVLNWLIEGAIRYKQNGLQPYITDRMRDFTANVRADRDAAGSFVEDCVRHKEGEGVFVTAGALYKAFVRYCQANGIDPILNSTAFGRQVKRVDVDGTTLERRKAKVQGVRRFNNIELHDVPEPEDDQSTAERLGMGKRG